MQDGWEISYSPPLDPLLNDSLLNPDGYDLRNIEEYQKGTDPTVAAPECSDLKDNDGDGFTAKMVRSWLERLEIHTLFIEPGSPWENGYIESFRGKFRDELLNGETFETLKIAKVLVEDWRLEYNGRRPHSSLGYKPPAPGSVSVLPFTFTCVILAGC